MRLRLPLLVCLAVQTSSYCCGAEPLVRDVTDVLVSEATAKDGADWLQKLKAREFAKLEAIADELRKTNAKYRDGHSRLVVFCMSLGNVADAKTDQDFTDRMSLIREWITQFPKSVSARTSMAQAWFAFSYFARGAAASNAVSSENLQKFRDRCQQASNDLDEIEKNSLPLDAGYYYIRINTCLGLNRKPEIGWVYGALESDPFQRDVIDGMTNCLTLRWFGKPGDIEQFADDVTRHTAKNDAGDFHYAMVALFAETIERELVFVKYQLDWSRVRAGLFEFEKRFPKSREHIQGFVNLAVLANDVKTAYEVVQRFGESPAKSRLSPKVFEGDQTALITHLRKMVMVELRHGGDSIVSCDTVLNERTYDLATGRAVSGGELRGVDPMSISASGSADLLACALKDQPNVIIMRLADRLTKNLTTASPPKLTQFTPDGSKIAYADEAGNIAILGVSMGESIRPVSAGMKPVNEMRFSGNGLFLAAVSDAGMIRIMGSKPDKDSKNWNIGQSNLRSVAWTAKSERLAVGDNEGHIKVFSWPAKKLIKSVDVEKLSVETLEFSPDGLQLAIGLCSDKPDVEVTNPLRLVTVAGNAPPVTLNGHKMGVRKVRFQPEGTHLVSASDDWTIRRWDLKTAISKK